LRTKIMRMLYIEDFHECHIVARTRSVGDTSRPTSDNELF
jgi:hypothetical protein